MVAELYILLAATTVSQPKFEALLGKVPPSFDLPKLTDGNVSLNDLKGNPSVFVIGTTLEGAPPSREWMLALKNNLARTKTQLYQIAVLDNPWYLPEFATKGRLKDFVPEDGYHLVLLDWGKQFRLDYGIPKDHFTRLLILDAENIVRWTHLGPLTDTAMLELLAKLEQL
ncbi:MAG: hypothetical protein A2289_09330 [Deltaproteobacteria bacterium RIFOXYA12_FULL_58_15]|nr:MAG: hypothetical protein A2289_09330 [Deltaproteobacteria bacterium RIFOXYA12_FULL_58_15]OGR12235.1 MAG: hypothetical protein A2341_21120 [Deltaproteobacteria bacterium RIFOXYB12_FULL_58_9]